MGTYDDHRQYPMYWMNEAEKLHDAALKVANGCSENQLSFDPVFHMLCGMSLEVVLKGIALSKGKQFSQVHDLIQLAKEAGVEFTSADEPRLKLLTCAIIWDGRYPVPKDKRGKEKWDEIATLESSVRFDAVQLGDSQWKVGIPNGSLGTKFFERVWCVAKAEFWGMWESHRRRGNLDMVESDRAVNEE